MKETIEQQLARYRTEMYKQVQALNEAGIDTSSLQVSVWDSPQWKFISSALLTQDADTLATMRHAALAAIYTPVNECVLITGESGTGKETFARTFAVGRKFVAINCTSLPDYLVESELFGHKRGAFTGAIDDRIGLFEAAEDGVLFIDEIGDMPVSMQPKLLRCLQERTVRRVGSNVESPIRCRVVVATHCDLEALAESGAFRLDLYWRIATHVLRIKPLRSRPQDAALFLQQQDARDVVYDANLKGNYRELQALVARYRLRKHIDSAGMPPASK